MRRSWSRLTSGLSSTPRTTLKMAALAPIPRASVKTTVNVRPLARASERSANLRSVMRFVVCCEGDPLRIAGPLLLHRSRKASFDTGPGKIKGRLHHRAQVFLESVVSLGGAFLHTRRDHGVALL